MNTPNETHSTGSLYYVTPDFVMDYDNKLVEPLAKLLYGLLTGLSSNGSCFPSDEYISKRMQCSLRKAKDLVYQLEKAGLIERETKRNPSNPFRSLRIIHIVNFFKKSCARAQPCPPGGEKVCPPVVSYCAPIESKAILESKEDIEGAEAPPICISSLKKKVEPKQEVSPFVFLTPTQQNSLLKKLEGNQDKLDKCYQKLSAWRISDQDYAGCSYLKILKWVIRAVEKDEMPQSAYKKPEVQNEENKRIAEAVIKKYRHRPDINLIADADAIEFSVGSARVLIKFSHHKFWECVKKELVNRKLEWKGILDG
jgi:hypothetical protein